MTIQRSRALGCSLLLASMVDGFMTPGSVTSNRPTTFLASTVLEDATTATTITVVKAKAEEEPAAELASKSWDDDGFVFGLDGSGLERPKGKVAQVVLEGDSLETTNTQRAIVWSTLLGHAGIFTYCFMGMLQGNQGLSFAEGNDALTFGITALQAILVTLFSWASADFGSGVLHWSVDNYGNGRTPIFGGIIAAFQGHHSAPWTICERGFENNIYKLCVPFGIQTVLAMKFVFGLGPSATLFWSFFCVMEIMSQEFHKMSHATKADAGPIWNGLQDMGISIGRKSHAQHHIAPYDGNYCIVSGLCNKALDESGFFRRLEHIVYNLNGVESNSWKLDAKLRERTLKGEYRLPGSN